MNDTALAGELPTADQLAPVHFIGVGGAGMSGIARIMLARGMVVSGSDAKESVLLTALRAEGATVHVGHDPAHPTLCARCTSNLYGAGEVRRVA